MVPAAIEIQGVASIQTGRHETTRVGTNTRKSGLVIEVLGGFLPPHTDCAPEEEPRLEHVGPEAFTHVADERVWVPQK